jgi:uncharacterized membrane protein YkvA (DUF1232 family)
MPGTGSRNRGGRLSKEVAITEQRWFQRQSRKWKRDVAFVLCQARMLRLLVMHPRVPWYAKFVAGCTAAYIFSPIQFIPTFIPVIGQLDDLLVLFLGMKLIRRLTPKNVLAECEAQAKSSAVVQSLENEPSVLAGRPSNMPAA